MSPTTTTGRSVPTLGVPAAPPLPDDLEAVLRRLRLPHIRRHAPEVIATAKAQRWEPLEVLRALFADAAADGDDRRRHGVHHRADRVPHVIDDVDCHVRHVAHELTDVVEKSHADLLGSE